MKIQPVGRLLSIWLLLGLAIVGILSGDMTSGAIFITGALIIDAVYASKSTNEENV